MTDISAQTPTLDAKEEHIATSGQIEAPELKVTKSGVAEAVDEAVVVAGNTYEFGVTMTCGGCSGAVTRVIKSLEGVESFDVSLPNQTAIVKTASKDTPTYMQTLSKIVNTRKTVLWGRENGEDRPIVVQPVATPA